MTEDEAKRKWCPYTAPQGAGVPCIASGCMAWRWINKVNRDSDGKPRLDGIGYCGLAGEP